MSNLPCSLLSLCSAVLKQTILKFYHFQCGTNAKFKKDPLRSFCIIMLTITCLQWWQTIVKTICMNPSSGHTVTSTHPIPNNILPSKKDGAVHGLHYVMTWKFELIISHTEIQWKMQNYKLPKRKRFKNTTICFDGCYYSDLHGISSRK